MITVNSIQDNNIEYSCECGVQGKCLVKPFKDGYEKVVRLTCPSCDAVETVFMKDNDVCYDEDTHYSFAVVVDNKIIKFQD